MADYNMIHYIVTLIYDVGCITLSHDLKYNLNYKLHLNMEL